MSQRCIDKCKCLHLQSRKIKIDKAEYHPIDDDVYLFFINTESYYDAVVIRFANNTINTIHSGTFNTLNPDRGVRTFNHDIHFWGGSVEAENPINVEFVSGTVIISNICFSKIKINFSFITEKGDEVKGAYDGTIVGR